MSTIVLPPICMLVPNVIVFADWRTRASISLPGRSRVLRDELTTYGTNTFNGSSSRASPCRLRDR